MMANIGMDLAERHICKEKHEHQFYSVEGCSRNCENTDSEDKKVQERQRDMEVWGPELKNIFHDELIGNYSEWKKQYGIAAWIK